ncbi:hypothetical protein GCM10011371_31820 [Novosphingobium marinum]|uniref:DNA-binding NarL/FixJ family response regulator n=1 Tax=Novosphingobium marinum TaxID=1514948 RepID=A0A7Y9Y1E4_9SPHN|nr:response regulator [Novosphingobium marinum]NYH96958.1 DNA-binding NarL/FixJ family response regulator [Novosphingobium marinum]GGC42051.1 hypothetical protein GCM10011371_31820 [Novosphingobium marinum]
MSDRKTLVIVEDDFLIAEYLRVLSEDMGAEVVGMASEADQGRELIGEKVPDYVIMDVRLGGKRDGVDIAIEVHERHPHIKIIFVTGSNEPPTLDRIQQDDPHRVLIKPINPGDLESALNS